MNISYIFVFLFLVLIPHFSHASWVRVGNGGTGIPSQQGYSILDLVESGTDKNPWIGDKIHPLLRRSFETSTLASIYGSEEDLLLRKLSDIEEISPGLGFALLEAMKLYTWQFSNEYFRIPKRDAPNKKEKLAYMPMASRGSSTIFIYELGWETLSLVQRVALLIHEATSSLAKVYCGKTGCTQDTPAVRPLVGNFFAKAPVMDRARYALDALNIEVLDSNLWLRRKKEDKCLRVQAYFVPYRPVINEKQLALSSQTSVNVRLVEDRNHTSTQCAN